MEFWVWGLVFWVFQFGVSQVLAFLVGALPALFGGLGWFFADVPLFYLIFVIV